MVVFGAIVCSFLCGLIGAMVLMAGIHLQEICDLRNKIASLQWEANWEERKKKEGKYAMPPPPPIHHGVSY